MKKALLFLLTISLLLPLGALSSTAYVVDILGEFTVTTEYAWDSEELKPLVDSLPEHSVTSLGTVTEDGKILNVYELILTGINHGETSGTVEEVQTHNEAYLKLSDSDLVTVSAKHVFNPAPEDLYVLGEFFVSSKYTWDSEYMTQMAAGLPAYTYELSMTLPANDKRPETEYWYFIVLEDSTKHDEVYDYLTSYDELEIELNWLAFPEKPNYVTPEKGDVNCDGTVNSLDAAAILKYDVKMVDNLSAIIGDVNNDGKVNSLDAALILRYDAGLIEKF